MTRIVRTAHAQYFLAAKGGLMLQLTDISDSGLHGRSLTFLVWDLAAINLSIIYNHLKPHYNHITEFDQASISKMTKK